MAYRQDARSRQEARSTKIEASATTKAADITTAHTLAERTVAVGVDRESMSFARHARRHAICGSMHQASLVTYGASITILVRQRKRKIHHGGLILTVCRIGTDLAS
jgi:hypothetical protein